ncbi:membrane protein [Streptomyces spiralis]|uniref:Membrane protein n=2 Tax=Streptomyces TaxID=1883 RepID=A0A919A6U2_9ACTN|nr:membrane protein [Streptomyces spiralis]
MDTEEWIEMLRYTLMRLGIFVGCLVVVWGLVHFGIAPRGLGSSNGLWIALLALVVSAPISFVALRKERDRASVQVARRVDRMKANMQASAGAEDLADERARARSQAS